MKNKKFTIGVTLLMAGSLLLTNCTKNKTNAAPSPDYEFESTKDVSRIQMVVADIHEICAEAYESGAMLPEHNAPTALSIMEGTTTVSNGGAVISVGGSGRDVDFTDCVGWDGHIRRGKLSFVHSTSLSPTATFYRQPGFICQISTPTMYSIDSYTILINSMTIENTTSKPSYDFPNPPTVHTPSNTNMTWDVKANITITSPAGTETFNGSITKTLLNTNNTPVPMPMTGSQTFTVYPKIAGVYGTVYNPANQYISYDGTGSMSLANIGATSFTITNVTRNMNSSPEAFYKDGSNMFVTPERHPFLSGFMSFKPGSKSTRDVDYGNGAIVDYNAKVTIEGITYNVDCKD